MPVGGIVKLSLTNAEAADVSAMYLVPALPSAYSTDNGFPSLATLLAKSNPCLGIAAGAEAGSVQCTPSRLQVGNYSILIMLLNNVTIIASGDLSLTVRLAISSVTPHFGSIGGNTTLTITGYGFSVIPGENVVLISVPRSTTHPNGYFPCDVVSSTASEVKCLTRPHLTTNTDDPYSAKGIKPVPTPLQDLIFVLCDANETITDLLKAYCYADFSSPLAVCQGDCRFSYSWNVTPSVLAVSPAAAYPGNQVSITGERLNDVQEVQLVSLSNNAIVSYCPIVGKDFSYVRCTVPSGELLHGAFDRLVVVLAESRALR